jgi:uncharacterized protein YacL
MKLFGDISNFKKISDYLSMLNGSIFADLLVLVILYYTPYFNSKYLKKWYEKYRLSAVIADVLILVIGLIITRFVYYYIFNVFNPIYFIILLVIIQIIHDVLFYLFFINVPRGINKMLDLFKDYSSEVSAKAIAGDTFMIIIAGLVSMIFANNNLNMNIISLIIMVYLIPYILYTK